MTKQELLAIIEAMPETTAPESFDRLAAEAAKIRFIEDVQAGLDEIERGDLIPHEEVEAEIEAWLKD